MVTNITMKIGGVDRDVTIRQWAYGNGWYEVSTIIEGGILGGAIISGTGLTRLEAMVDLRVKINELIPEDEDAVEATRW